MEEKPKQHVYAFEKLEVYQLALRFSVALKPVLAGFPDDERYSLTAQIRRSAYSVAANVAEGSGRASPADRAYFMNIAFCSALETINHLNIAKELKYISAEVYKQHRMEMEEITNKLNALYKYQIKQGKNLKQTI